MISPGPGTHHPSPVTTWNCGITDQTLKKKKKRLNSRFPTTHTKEITVVAGLGLYGRFGEEGAEAKHGTCRLTTPVGSTSEDS